MAFFWFNAKDRSHPWHVRLDSGDVACRELLGVCGVTVQDGKKHGLPTDYAFRFTIDAATQLVEPVPVENVKPGPPVRRQRGRVLR